MESGFVRAVRGTPQDLAENRRPVTQKNPYRDQRTTAISGSLLSLASTSYLHQSSESGAFRVRRRFTNYHRFLRLMVRLRRLTSVCGAQDYSYSTSHYYHLSQYMGLIRSSENYRDR
jgi:hypothetical protein